MTARALNFALSLAFATASAATFAAAASLEPVSLAVPASDLDPGDPADRAKFELRLKNAARSACQTGIDSRWAKAEEQRCLEEIITGSASWAN
ncbi:MAG: UrcA family protein [Novosphingobium sp.]|uniref:UrcA family protein n=1 Tax=Novosphingobium sp. TaxID=1874826 RepID=UPI0032B9AE9C